MAEVVLRQVAKRYGDVTVIEGLDLDIADREFMVLVGPSGCGKTTALRMIAGLEEMSGGTISIGGRVVNGLPPKDRDIAMVFQSYALYPHMTVRENLEFGLRMRKAPRAERERLVAEAAQILGLDQLLERKPRQLSGGQRQRVAVGRAIVRQPAVFLFDEPLSNLDAKLRVAMRAEITKLQQRLETTTVYVTHDQVEAMTMGRRIAVMNQGKLQQVGEPLEVYRRPRNLFVARFIGTPPMNVFRAQVDSGGAALVHPAFTLPVPEAARAALAGGGRREVYVGIRPENLTERERAAAGATAAIPLEVELVEPLGHEVVVHGRAGEDAVTAKLAPTRVPAVGSRLELAVELGALHLFDAGTEARIN